MSPDPLLIEGQVDEFAAERDQLRDEIASLRSDLRLAQREGERARGDAQRSVSALRQQLSPLYRALQMVFGEMETFGESPETPTADNPRVARVWEEWKEKLGRESAASRVIDALRRLGSGSVCPPGCRGLA